MKKFLIILFAINVLLANPASALFGSECKKPKASYQTEIANAAKYKNLAYSFTKAQKVDFFLKLSQQRAKVYKDCTSRKLLTVKECRAMKELQTKLDLNKTLTDVTYLDKMKFSLNTAYRIVLNNQKCFEPVLVVEAQRALGQ